MLLLLASHLHCDSPFQLSTKHPREQKEHLDSTSVLLTILISVKAREGGAEDFDKVAHASQVLVHVPEVGVDVVTIPEKQQAPALKAQSFLITKAISPVNS